MIFWIYFNLSTDLTLHRLPIDRGGLEIQYKSLHVTASLELLSRLKQNLGHNPPHDPEATGLGTERETGKLKEPRYQYQYQSFTTSNMLRIIIFFHFVRSVGAKCRQMGHAAYIDCIIGLFCVLMVSDRELMSSWFPVRSDLCQIIFQWRLIHFDCFFQ